LEGVFIEKNEIYLQFPYCEQGNLHHWLHKINPLQKHEIKREKHEIKSVFRNILQGIAYLHNYNIIHRDIKPKNILMTKNTPKICDFGASKQLFNFTITQTMGIGTFKYMAPEVISQEAPSSFKSDMYSFGVMLYESFFGELKYSQEGTVIIPKSENEHLTNLLKKLLDKDPNNRPSANECLAHPYFSISSIEDAKRNKSLIESDKKN